LYFSIITEGWCCAASHVAFLYTAAKGGEICMKPFYTMCNAINSSTQGTLKTYAIRFCHPSHDDKKCSIGQ